MPHAPSARTLALALGAVARPRSAFSALLLAAALLGCGRTPPFEVAPGDDAGEVDGGTCAVAADCPGSAPACDDLTRCACGTSRVCRAGLCGQLTVECAPDAGPPPECRAASDCPAPRGDVFCGGPAASASCVDGRCVADCGGPRTCAVSPEGCRACDGADPICPVCEFARSFGATVESTSCRAGEASALRRGDQLRVEVEVCPWAVLTGPRGVVGRVGPYFVGDWVLVLADGTSCLGSDLPTGAKRVSFACPSCTAVVRFNN
jgi:hypothetical protein